MAISQESEASIDLKYWKTTSMLGANDSVRNEKLHLKLHQEVGDAG